MSDEQRVRTMAGWIGVEISKSRVRTPGREGYGLYRVRGGRWWIAGNSAEPGPVAGSERETGEWTPYAFTLSVVFAAVRNSIEQGRPSRPMDLALNPSLPSVGMVHMNARWTSAYRGRRDLGEPIPVLTRDEAQSRRMATEMDEFTAALGEGLVMRHTTYCVCDVEAQRFTYACVMATWAAGTVRRRQRAHNAEFQAEHLRARAWGLEQRRRRKLGSNAPMRNEGA